MTKNPKQNGAIFKAWLSAWHRSIQNLNLLEGADPASIDHQDFLVKCNLPRLTALLDDEPFIDLLAKAHQQLGEKLGDDDAKNAIRTFIMNACWICKPSLSQSGGKKHDTIAAPGDLKKDLLNLNKACIKLAKQIEVLPSHYSPDSQTYLEARLRAGNPIGYILKRKNVWRSALPPSPDRRLSELLRCFADDINEEAALQAIAIDGRRQKGGAQAGLHLAMDGLTSASMSLSDEQPRKPNFSLVNRAIATLLDPPNSFDPSTARRRFMAAQKRKTRT